MVAAAVAVAALLGTSGCSGTPTPSAVAPAGGVKVSGNRLESGAGRPIQLAGVGRSGSEYECLSGRGVFDGPSGASSVAAIAGWHADAVRVPLNEDCWLGLNGVPAATSGGRYVDAIAGFVQLLQSRGIEVVLDLHWSAPGGYKADGQQRMPDADHSVAFWTSVARRFGADRSVMLELYNEPYGVSWSCWRNGCEVGPHAGTGAYRAVGMQQLVDAVRRAGARNPIVVDGLARASTFTGWTTHAPHDPLDQLVAGWHVYGPSSCTVRCWGKVVSEIGSDPVLVTEMGQQDCGSSFVRTLMAWLDGRNIGYLAWAWDTWSGCSGPPLVKSYTGTPANSYGAAVRSHFQARFPSP